ncbi:uncharacterized protein E0L32_003758 [Thyridium curvatum]|uniref:GFO/IDH/MocA-like oxidoreductase domain-containing protein n=1 Tax=Thyridium curvatum TaxID=1093900 RepID=A0A507BCS3_9PEZI|nr:uncharacterized protein E0L32_003758 [Thyridium curvatum]TPX16464.1 hypothetical protein E0L32_003758 [Thyridium curvatum]
MYGNFSIKNLATYVRPALLARKHVLSEKPAVGENVKDSVALIKWHDSFGLIPSTVHWYQPWPDTEWRNQPTHQGGFLLDGGVHYMAGLRDLLASQPRNEIARVSAFTIQLQEHLPPVDATNVVIRTKSDITGSFQISVRTTLREDS